MPSPGLAGAPGLDLLSRPRGDAVPADELVSITASDDLPQLFVEWIPDSGPNDVDGTWEQMGAYVAKGAPKRGRTVEFDRFEAGSLTLTLRADTRLFDPENTAGAYYGKLLPMRQIRVRAKWQAVWYDIFRGYVTSWGTTVPKGDVFTTTVQARDAMFRLAQITLPSSAWALEIVKDNPSMWLRLGETDTARLTDSSPGGNYGLYDNCQQGAQGLVVNDSDSGAAFAHSLEERVYIQNPDLITGYPFTFSCMFKIDGSHPAGFKTIFAGQLGVTFGPGIWIAMVATYPGTIAINLNDGAGNTNYRGTVAQYDDDLPHHLAIVVTAGNTATIYVDGVVVNTGVGSTGTGNPSWPGSPPNGYTVGNTSDLLYGDYGFGTNDTAAATPENPFPVKQRGIIDEVCVWNGVALSADRIAAHAAAALEGWEGDDTGTRVNRFLDAIGWPATLRDIDAGIALLGPTSWSAGSTALAVLQAWADTELGAFVVGRDGKIVWRSRHYPLLDTNATRSQLTFGETAGTAPMSVDNLDLSRDSTLVRNPVTASRRNGVSVTVRDDYLADQVYGDRAWTAPNTEENHDSVVRDRATWLRDRFKEEQLRLRNLTCPVRARPQYWGEVLGLELGDRATVQVTPLGLNNQIATDQIIESIGWTFTPASLEPSFTGSPVDPNVGSYLILDDANFGLLDTGLLAY